MNFQKRKLKNGITLLYEERNLPVVSLSITNPFGASHETSEIKGIAHFIEHLVFTGTKKRTHEDISREIEKKGGILNAFTAQDVTSFWFKLPSEHIFKGLDIFVDMLNNPIFNPEKFEKEKKVVLEEIKMYHDNPIRHVHEKIEENLYEPPFGMGIAGNKDTVSSLSRDFVKDYFLEKYSADNFIVTIVGKTNIEEVAEYLEKNFAKKSLNSKHQEVKIKKNVHTTEERPGIDQAHIVIAAHAPSGTDPEIFTLEVLDAYLANGMSSKLFLTIREERGLAYTVKSSINTEKNYSYYSIYVGTTKEALSEVKKLILEGFKDAALKITEKDIKEAKERIIGLQKVTSEESSSVMNDLVFSEIISGSAENYYKREEKINAVTLEQVKSLASKIIEDYCSAIIAPK